MFAIGRNLVRSLAFLTTRHCRYLSKNGSEYEGSGGSHILPSGNPNYEGDGKTTVSVINDDIEDDHLMVLSYSAAGFRLNNKIFVVGPIALFPKTVLQWNIESIETLTPAAFSLFTLLEPKVDVLIIGSGERKVHLNEKCNEYLRKQRITFELLPTPEAIPVFNFLNSERRNVAALFIPPADIFRESDTIANKILAGSIKGTLFRQSTDFEKREVKELQMFLKSKERFKELEEESRLVRDIKEDIIKEAEIRSITKRKTTPDLTDKCAKDKDKK